ncbi:MAG: hypothetical protein PPP58_12660 [Natronomonas sp.]
MTSIEWQYGPAQSTLLSGLAYGAVVPIGGAAFLSASVLGIAVPEPIRGNAGVLVIAAVLLVVGGPLSVGYLWPLVAEYRAGDGIDLDPAAPFGDTWPYTVRGTLAASLVGAFLLAVALQIGAVAVFSLVAGSVAATVCASMLSTTGTIEPAYGRMTVDRRTVELRRITAVRRLRIGGCIVCLPVYTAKAGLFPPRVLLVGAKRDDVIRSLEAAVDRPTLDAGRQERDPIAATVLGVSGILFLSVAILAVGAHPIVGVYAGAALGACGLLVVVAAYRGV